MSPNLVARWGEGQGQVANYLQGIVAEQAAQGWEFQRVDAFSMVEQAGCGCAAFLARTFLGQPSQREYTVYVATFRAMVGQAVAAVPPSPT